MSGVIQKPDAYPVLAALVAVFFDLGHVVINGQSRKWLFTTLAVHLGFVLCCLAGIVLRVLSIIDACQTAERLQAGEAIAENEYSQPWLFKLVRVIDDGASWSRA